MSLVGPTFLFDDRKRFDAQLEHDRVRNQLLTDIEPARTADPWKQRPVDFSMKNFHPNRKKTKEIFPLTSSSNEKSSIEFDFQLDSSVMEPFVSPFDENSQRTGDSDDFDLDPRIRYERVKRMLNTEQYRNPQPHDFRQYPDLKQLGLPEFQTKYHRDPYNLKFLSQRLNTSSSNDEKMFKTFFVLLSFSLAS